MNFHNLIAFIRVNVDARLQNLRNLKCHFQSIARSNCDRVSKKFFIKRLIKNWSGNYVTSPYELPLAPTSLQNRLYDLKFRLFGNISPRIGYP